jgi:hypothetical protein
VTDESSTSNGLIALSTPLQTTLAFLPFINLFPASGPLHLLFLSPKALFCQLFVTLHPSFVSGFSAMSPPQIGLPDHSITLDPIFLNSFI